MKPKVKFNKQTSVIDIILLLIQLHILKYLTDSVTQLIFCDFIFTFYSLFAITNIRFHLLNTQNEFVFIPQIRGHSLINWCRYLWFGIEIESMTKLNLNCRCSVCWRMGNPRHNVAINYTVNRLNYVTRAHSFDPNTVTHTTTHTSTHSWLCLCWFTVGCNCHLSKEKGIGGKNKRSGNMFAHCALVALTNKLRIRHFRLIYSL